MTQKPQINLQKVNPQNKITINIYIEKQRQQEERVIYHRAMWNVYDMLTKFANILCVKCETRQHNELYSRSDFRKRLI